MKVAVIGASGKSGSLILNEAIERGHDVTAIVRDSSKLSNQTVKVIEKPVLNLTYADLEPFDVIVDALGFWENPEQHYTYSKHLLDILKGKPNRIIFVGGAGSLYVDPEHKVALATTPDFPASYKPVAVAMQKAFDLIRADQDVNWSYLSPAPIFNADGARTGSYKLGEEEVIVNSQGEPSISYADYAIAIVDEIEKNLHNKKRFTVVSV